MDIRIIQVVLDIFDHYGEMIRFEDERFENALNDEAPDLMDECYLVALGFKMGIFDAMIFDEERDERGYVDYLKEVAKLNERDALFLVAVLKTILDEVGYYFEIAHIEDLYQQSFERQDFDQLLIIAKTYFKGFGVAQDYEKAFQIYAYLYSHEDKRGAYYLGYMYEHGYGVERNIEKAILYYQSYEDDYTCLRLGRFYMLGQYLPRDDEMAYEYLSKSHHKEACFYKGMLCEMNKDYAGAVEAYDHGAKLFHSVCMYKLATYLRMGIGVDLNLQEAFQYYEYAYFFLNGESAYQLSMFSFDGIEVDKDEKKAMRYLTQAAMLGSDEACLTLAQFYELGYHVQKNHREALAYYQKASQLQLQKSEIIKESRDENDENL